MVNKRYNDYPKEKTKRPGAVGRPFKLEIENRFLMLLVYYRCT